MSMVYERYCIYGKDEGGWVCTFEEDTVALALALGSVGGGWGKRKA